MVEGAEAVRGAVVSEDTLKRVVSPACAAGTGTARRRRSPCGALPPRRAGPWLKQPRRCRCVASAPPPHAARAPGCALRRWRGARWRAAAAHRRTACAAWGGRRAAASRGRWKGERLAPSAGGPSGAARPGQAVGGPADQPHRARAPASPRDAGTRPRPALSTIPGATQASARGASGLLTAILAVPSALRRALSVRCHCQLLTLPES